MKNAASCTAVQPADSFSPSSKLTAAELPYYAAICSAVVSGLYNGCFSSILPSMATGLNNSTDRNLPDSTASIKHVHPDVPLTSFSSSKRHFIASSAPALAATIRAVIFCELRVLMFPWVYFLSCGTLFCSAARNHCNAASCVFVLLFCVIKFLVFMYINTNFWKNT